MLERTDYSHLGILALVVVFLALAVWAAIVTIRDGRLTNGTKIAWVVVIFIFPVIGLLVWILTRLSRRRPTGSAQ